MGAVDQVLVVEVSDAGGQLEQLALVGIVSQIVAQRRKGFIIQHARQQGHQLPAHALFVKGALAGDFGQDAGEHVPDKARGQREVDIRGNAKALGQRHLQPLRHPGTLYEDHFRLERVRQAVLLNDELHQCFQHVQTVGVVDP